MDTIELHLQITNSLNKTLKETQATMKSFNSLLEQSAKSFAGVAKTGEVVSDNYDDIEQATKRIGTGTNIWQKGMEKIRQLAHTIAARIGTIFSVASVIRLTQGVLDLNTQMRNLAFRMGEGAEAAGILQQSALDITKSTGLAREEATQLVGALRRLRVSTKDIEELGKATTRFSQITGISVENAARLSGQLIRTGRMSSEASKSILTMMANVQRSVGMAESDMEQLADTTIYATKMLYQLGKTSTQIEQFNKGVVSLAASFHKVGIDAEETNKIITDLLDPERIEDNALLYAKLGVSLQDVLAGNVDPGILAGKFRDLGQEIKTMTPMAGAALSKQLGMSLGQMRAMADIDITKTDDMKDLTTMAEEQASAGEKFTRTMEKLRGFFAEIGTALMPTIEKVATFISEKADSILKFTEELPKLFDKVGSFIGKIFDKKIWIIGALALIGIVALVRRKFMAVATDFGRTLEVATSEGIAMGTARARTMAQRRPEDIGGRVDIAARTRAGRGYGEVQREAGTFDVMAKSNIFPAVARMTENTAEWLRLISMGSKKVSLLQVLTEQNNMTIQERLKFAKQENTMLTDRYEQVKRERTERVASLQLQLEEAKKAVDSDNNRADAQAAIIKLTRAIRKEETEIGKLKNRIAGETDRFGRIEYGSIRRMGLAQQKNLYLELEQRQQILEAQRERAKQEQTDIQTQGLILSNQKQMLEAQQKSLELELSKPGASKELLKDYQENTNLLKDINTRLDEGRSRLSDLTEELKESNKESMGLEQNMEMIVKAAGKATAMDLKSAYVPGPEAITRTRKLLDFVGSTFRKAGDKLADSFDKVKQSAKQIGTNIVERLNPANWIKGIMAKIRGVGDQEAKETKGIFSSIGGLLKKFGIPLMIIGAILPLLKPIFEKFKPALDMVVNVFKSVLDALGPAIDALVPVVMELVKALLPPLMKVLGLLLIILGKVITTFASVGQWLIKLPTHFEALIAQIRGWINRTPQEITDAYVEQLYKVRDLELEVGNDAAAIAYRVLKGVGNLGQAILDTGTKLMTGEIGPGSVQAQSTAGVGTGGPTIFQATGGTFVNRGVETQATKEYELAVDNNALNQQMLVAAEASIKTEEEQKKLMEDQLIELDAMRKELTILKPWVSRREIRKQLAEQTKEIEEAGLNRLREAYEAGKELEAGTWVPKNISPLETKIIEKFRKEE